MTLLQHVSFSLTTLVGVSLVACGGGGGGGESTAPPMARTELAQALAPGVATVTANRVGVGIAGLSYYDRSFAMADIGRQSQVRGWDWSYNVVTDSLGNPGQDFQLIYSATKIAAGTYKLAFNGRATVSAGGAGSVQNATYDSAKNLTTADIVLPTDRSGNVWLGFKNTYKSNSSVTSDGISNIQMMRPGYTLNGPAVFTKEFIAAMQGFKIIRGMDFTNTNGNPQQRWDVRTKPGYFGATGSNGQSWELMIALANAAGRDIWLNVPARADDDYIRKLAQLVKFGSDGTLPYSSARTNPVHAPLNSGLKVYVEYGNEIWNSGPGFQGFGWALQLAKTYMGDITHPIAFDGAQTDQYVALRRWIAYRSSYISLAFREVFGDNAMMYTVRPILASQVGNGNSYLSTGLAWAQSYYGKVRNAAPLNAVVRLPSDIWYGGGGAAYYDSSINPSDATSETLDAYFANLPTPSFARSSIVDSIWTHAYGLKYVAYEGGPGPGGSALGSVTGAAISPMFNNDPRMKSSMLLAQDIWDQAGGDELVYYVYSGPAPWSFTNDLLPQVVSDTGSVKLQAIAAINAKTRPQTTLGNVVPGIVRLKDPSSNTIGADDAPWAFNNSTYLLRPTAPRSYVLVPIRIATAGTYQISLQLGKNVSAGSVALHANGVNKGEIALFQDPANPNASGSKLSVALPAGLSVLRLDTPKGSQDIFVKDVIVQ
jgi:hypothetical protein